MFLLAALLLLRANQVGEANVWKCSVLKALEEKWLLLQSENDENMEFLKFESEIWMY